MSDQVLNRAAPAWMLLGWAVYTQRGGTISPAADKRPSNISYDKSSRALLLIWGIVPLLFMPLVGLTTGADLQLQWGTPFLLFAVPAAMELSSHWVVWSRQGLRPALKAFVVIQALLILLSHLTSPRGLSALNDHHWRSFDSAALARAIAPEALRGRICVVSGPAAIAGGVALQLPERPSVLIDGRYGRSPWGAKNVVDMCGSVELSDGVPLAGGRAVGPAFPGLSWRVQPPSPIRDANTTAMYRLR